MNCRVGLLVVLILSISACHVDGGSTQAVSGVSTSADSPSTLGVKLPFESDFSNRLNPSNDGTPYEPCVAFSDQELLRFGIDPARVEDAAQVDGQGIRGCGWIMPDRFSLSSVVTNAESIDGYRAGKPELEWKPDLLIEDRVVGLADLNDDETSCSTYVESYGSIVATTVMVSAAPQATAELDPCQIVVDFTTAYIDKIPD